MLENSSLKELVDLGLDLSNEDIESLTVYLGLVIKGSLLDIVRLRETLKGWLTVRVVYQHLDSGYLFITRGIPAAEGEADEPRGDLDS